VVVAFVSVNVVRESETRAIEEGKYEGKGGEGGKDCDWDA